MPNLENKGTISFFFFFFTFRDKLKVKIFSSVVQYKCEPVSRVVTSYNKKDVVCMYVLYITELNFNFQVKIYYVYKVDLRISIFQNSL